MGVLVECRPVPHFTGHFELKIENLCRGQLLATDLDSAVFNVVESSAPIYLVSVPWLAIEYLEPVVQVFLHGEINLVLTMTNIMEIDTLIAQCVALQQAANQVA